MLRAIGTALADLVLPRTCAVCGRSGQTLCAACLPRGQPLDVTAGGLPVRAAGGYDGTLRSALLAYKERGRPDLAAPLGALLGWAVRGVGAGQVFVPVPSSAASAGARGGDHVLRLARAAARTTRVPVVRALALTRDVADSAGLGRAERAANLAGAMRSRPPPAGVSAVIIDDIVTTGATLVEARRALVAAGWPVCGAAVVAATPRHANPISGSGTVRRGGLTWG
jgi:predicted amidophosphoribosyltransferase